VSMSYSWFQGQLMSTGDAFHVPHNPTSGKQFNAGMHPANEMNRETGSFQS